jgi:hypothetical protein
VEEAPAEDDGLASLHLAALDRPERGRGSTRGDKEGEEAGTSEGRRIGLTSAVVADGPWASSGVGLVDGRVPGGGGLGAREAMARLKKNFVFYTQNVLTVAFNWSNNIFFTFLPLYLWFYGSVLSLIVASQ